MQLKVIGHYQLIDILTTVYLFGEIHGELAFLLRG